MTLDEQSFDIKEFFIKVVQRIMECYWGKIYRIIGDNPDLISVVPGFLVAPSTILFYLGRTHLGVEYMGPETVSELPKGGIEVSMHYLDLSLKETNFLDEIVGFSYADGVVPAYLPERADDLVVPTNAGLDELFRLKWNWAAQDMALCMNVKGVIAPEGQFTRLVNCRFYDYGNSGLKTRHIKWLDLIPVEIDQSPGDYDRVKLKFSHLAQMVEVDARTPYPVPDDYKYEKLPRINRFVEIMGDRTKSETDITSFLASEEYRFIIAMRFAAIAIHSELICEWQSVTKKAIKPDFLVVGSDGYADIVEFKLPEPKGEIVVGRENRETFSSELNSYISQTRVYQEYFDDPNNRSWIEREYGFRVYKPNRYLIIGRRRHFDIEEWKQIESDYQNLKILTYDDLIDAVVTQFYN